jgi:hypothetical protein
MTISLIIAGLISLAPAITSVVGQIITFIKRRSELKPLINEIRSTKEYDELKDQLAIVHQENIELKKKLNELLTKIDHISRGENE